MDTVVVALPEVEAWSFMWWAVYLFSFLVGWTWAALLCALHKINKQ